MNWCLPRVNNFANIGICCRLQGLRLEFRTDRLTHDTRSPAFRDECMRQARLVAASDASDAQLAALMEQALEDLPPWQP